uniref:Uncharacterized protein n=1 Tax=Craspedostauros australis TaxID=1486917 RepID=A0A7R9WYK0_9STRA
MTGFFIVSPIVSARATGELTAATHLAQFVPQESIDAGSAMSSYVQRNILSIMMASSRMGHNIIATISIMGLVVATLTCLLPAGVPRNTLWVVSGTSTSILQITLWSIVLSLLFAFWPLWIFLALIADFCQTFKEARGDDGSHP